MSIDLSTRYLGLKLANPLVVSSCPLSGNLDTLRQLADAGAAAAVLPSLFEEQIEHQRRPSPETVVRSSELLAEGLLHFRELKDYNAGPDGYLRHLEAAKKAVSIPILGSLNGVTEGGWIRHAQLMEEAGADAIELNIYFVAANPTLSSAEVETRYLDIVSAVRQRVKVPLAVKIGPFFSSLANMARRLVAAGADGLTLFSRFVQPEIDLDTRRVRPHLVLSSSDELRMTIRWIAILRGQLSVSLAATGGIHFADDMLKVLLAGADVGMLASTLYRRGIGQLPLLLGAVEYWLEANGFASVEQAKGRLSQQRYDDPAAFERAGYMKTVTTFAGETT